MSPLRVTWSRTMGMARNLYSTSLSVGIFLSAAALLFAFHLEAAEGGSLSLAAVWSLSVSQVLPALAAILSMDVWSDERSTGRIESLLAAPVCERDFTLGKFLGVWTMLMAATLVFLAISLVLVGIYSPQLLRTASCVSFFYGLSALALQSLLWSAVGVALSALFCHSAVSALATLLAAAVLPRGLWLALGHWAPQGRAFFGEMPFDAQIVDIASGVLSTGTIIGYLLFSAAFLFVADKFIAHLRFRGRGNGAARWSSGISVTLALALAALVTLLAYRLEMVLDLNVTDGRLRFSSHTLSVLQNCQRKNITAIGFLSRHDPKFRDVGHFLRSLKYEADSLSSVKIAVRFVDPNLDHSNANRLTRRGIRADSIVFESDGKFAEVPLASGIVERDCASAILKLTMSPRHRIVYWIKGHGEYAFDDYGPSGMSDIARELSLEGYSNRSLSLDQEKAMPKDCALMVIAGPREDFSRAEIGKLQTYLKQGGRLLVLTDALGASGIAGLLSSWGIREIMAPLKGARTFSGTDVVVDDFANHKISEKLTGSQLVLDRPIAFVSSAAATLGRNTDQIEFTPLARCMGAAVAAASERGIGIRENAIARPTRIAAVGDPTFALNSQLAVRANANRDFFLNCVAYLSGSEALTSSGDDALALVSGMDRASRIGFTLNGAVFAPAGVFALLFLVSFHRRRRS